MLNLILGETPLHIAIVYNDMKSVILLIKHGVDVNKRVVGDFNTSKQDRTKDESNKRQRKVSKKLFHRPESSQKQFNPQAENPDSNYRSLIKKTRYWILFRPCLLWRISISICCCIWSCRDL